MTALSVNLNKVALLRNARGGPRPDVLAAAQTCIDAGADGITVHPRSDMRHIRPADVRALAGMLPVEFNIEGNPFAAPAGDYPGFMALVRETRPAQVTLVPDNDTQLTSDHGWPVAQHATALAPVIEECRTLGCRVSLFMDPVPDEYRLVRELGADRIELHTGRFASAFGSPRQAAVLERYRHAAEEARGSGLGLNAGHDLNLDNLATFLTIDGIEEVSIGHALIADALWLGLDETVRRYGAITAAA